MSYIRTKDGRIIDLDSKRISSYEIVDGKTAMEEYGEEKGFICVYYFDEDEGEHLERDDKGGRSMDNWYLDDITAQADSIEELCDGFIGVPDKEWCEKKSVAPIGVDYFQKPFDLKFDYYKKDFASLILKNQNGWEYTAIEWQKDHRDFIFGYIETEKGLIYVAKMNEKGKLELL